MMNTKTRIVIEHDSESGNDVKLYKTDNEMLPTTKDEAMECAVRDISIVSEALRSLIMLNHLNGYIDRDKTILSVIKHIS